VMKMILTVEMLEAWHQRSLPNMAERRIHKKQCMRHPSTVRSVRNLQPLGRTVGISEAGRACIGSLRKQ
jgi:hypothetical protein